MMMNSSTNQTAGSHPLDVYGDTQRIATIFYWFTGLLLAGLIAGILISLSAGDVLPAIYVGLGTLPVLASLYFIRRKKFELAAAFLAIVLISLITLVATNDLGIHHISVVGYPAVLIVASLVIRKRTMALLTIYTVVCAAWLVFGELSGVYTPHVLVRSVAGDFFSVSIIIILTAVMVRLVTESLFQSNRQLQKELGERKRAKQALSFSERKFYEAFHTTPVMMSIEDADNRFMDVNKAFIDTMGYSREDVLGRNASDLNMWATLEDMQTIRQMIKEQDGLKDLELRFRRKSGEIGYVLMSSEKFDVNGETYELTSALDITERKQAEAALQQSAAHLEILHEIDRALLSAHTLEEIAMSALKRIRRLIPCLRASVTLFDIGKNEARFLAASFDNADHDFGDTVVTLQEYGQYIIDELKQNNICRVDDVLSDPRANELDKQLAELGFLAWLYLPLHYQGQLIGALNLGRGAGVPFTQRQEEIAADVANQLAIAIQQTRLYNALQNELEERKQIEAERERLIADLETKNAELERFAYTVSHDLKSPLITIRGFLGFIEQDTQSGNTNRLKTDIQRISEATDKMQRLLIELLELSRIGRLMNEPETIPFADLVRDAMDNVHGQLEAGRVTVQTQPDLPAVYGDRQRLVEVLQNLIDNAAKFMGDQPDPRIEIGQRGEDAERGKPVFYVKDNGIGIASEHHERVFGLFNQLDPKMDGTGVGLAIVKRIVEFHGGRIWVESEAGKGAAFYFTLGKVDAK
jgi:PAS domain S-box-containing protein